jgi:hypothetical protein
MITLTDIDLNLNANSCHDHIVDLKVYLESKAKGKINEAKDSRDNHTKKCGATGRAGHGLASQRRHTKNYANMPGCSSS